MIKFKDLFRTELYKFKMSPARILVVIIPLLITAFVFYRFWTMVQASPDNGTNPWMLIFAYSLSFVVLTPFFYTLLAIYIVQDNLNRDFTNNAYELMFTFPMNKSHYFLSKICFSAFIISLSIVLLYLLLVLGVNISEMFLNDNKFYDYSGADFWVFTYGFLRLLIYSWVIILIQLIINRFSRNAVINIIVPIILSAISMIAINNPKFRFSPYGFIYNIGNSIDLTGTIRNFEIDGLAIGLILVLSYFYMNGFKKLVN